MQGKARLCCEHHPGCGFSLAEDPFCRLDRRGFEVVQCSAGFCALLFFPSPFNGNCILCMEHLVILLLAAAAASPPSSSCETPFYIAVQRTRALGLLLL